MHPPISSILESIPEIEPTERMAMGGGNLAAFDHLDRGDQSFPGPSL